MIRVLVVDDQPLVRAGVAGLLRGVDDITVVGEAQNGNEAIALTERLHPDVVIMDLRMPGMSGVEATRRIVQGFPAGAAAVQVVVLTLFPEDDEVVEALRAGAAGFVLKNLTAQELVTAIRTVTTGERLLSPDVTRQVLDVLVPRSQRPGSGGRGIPGDEAIGRRLRRLTDREADVLALLARGLSNQDIGRRLFIGEGTVKTHVHRILQKIEVQGRVQAAVFAHRSGLLGVRD